MTEACAQQNVYRISLGRYQGNVFVNPILVQALAASAMLASTSNILSYVTSTRYYTCQLVSLVVLLD